MRSRALLLVLPLVAFFGVEAPLSAQVPATAQAPLVLQRLSGPIVLDGRSDDAAWQGVTPLPVTQNIPTFGAPASERTELLVGYDDEYLYVAGRMYDSDPNGVQGNAYNRDHLSTSTDWLAVVVDGYNDNENTLVFGTTPTGLRTDYEVSDDGNAPNNVSWNTFWDAAVVRDSAGWHAEIRIPFASLRFQDVDGRVVMGLTVWRYIARKNEIASFPAIPPNWGFLSVNKPSQAQDVVLDGVRRRNRAFVTPYMLAGGEQNAELTPDELAYRRTDRFVREAGLDLKYPFRSNMTLDLSVNTDFAQVEADDQQINLTRFPLFFPEKRQFFQERAGVFDFRTGDADRLFHSRRIGLEAGRPVRIYGGGRLIGRVGGWDLGVLNMQTAAAEGSPATNFGVMRTRRRIVNETSYVGGMLTSRVGVNGRYNVALGFDGMLRPTGNEFVEVHAARTVSDSMTTGDPMSSSLLRVRWERRTVQGLAYDFSLTRVGEGYDPGLGFVNRTGVLSTKDRLSYGWRSGPDSRILRQTVSASGYVVLGSDDLAVQSTEVAGDWSVELKSGALLSLRAVAITDRPEHAFTLGRGVGVGAGDYAFRRVGGSFRLPWGGVLRGQVNVEAGEFYDGTQTSVTVRPTWHASPHLELTSEYQYAAVAFAERGERLHTHIGRLRGLAMVNTRLSAAGFVQYNSLLRTVVGNLRLRYNPTEGTDLYIVYNHLLNTDRLRDIPAQPVTGARTLMLKYSHALLSPW